MTLDEHIARHKELHRSLDELIADFITHNNCNLSNTTLMDFMEWSYLQTKSPTADKESGQLPPTPEMAGKVAANIENH